jgi:hypothetical protein
VLCLSFRVRSCLSPARHDCRAPSWGFVSPSRHKRMKSTCRRASRTRLRFALNVSHVLDDFLLHTPRGLISSRCHVRDSHLRDFPRCQADSPPRCVVPSCRYRVFPTGELPHQRQIHPPRLQGVFPSSGPLRPAGGLDLPSARSPLVFSLPRAFLRIPWRRLHASSAHDLPRQALAVHSTTGLQRINRHST